MKDEIKELLCFLADDNRADERFYKALDKDKCKILLDYITALQKDLKVACEVIEKLKSDKKKATKYIEQLPYMEYPDDLYEINHKMIEWDNTELLDILRGDDNNEAEKL